VLALAPPPLLGAAAAAAAWFHVASVHANSKVM
jgi:hypothetical protein